MSCNSLLLQKKYFFPHQVLLNLGPNTFQKLGKGFLRAAQESRGAGRPSGKGGDKRKPAGVSAWDYGHVYAVAGAWDRLGLTEALRACDLEGQSSFGAAEMVRLLVVNRLGEPTGQWALLDWMEGVSGVGDPRRTTTCCGPGTG